MNTTLITAEQLMALQSGEARLMVFDCTFDLTKPEAGAQQYRAAHIPGAVYANLDTDLSAKHGVAGAHGVVVAQDDGPPASGGRHPLPSREKFAAWLSSVGFANDMQAVVYDRNGASHCGRLWWMLKWMGHEAAAVLDGGLLRLAGGGRHHHRPRRALALPIEFRRRQAAAHACRHPDRREAARAS